MIEEVLSLTEWKKKPEILRDLKKHDFKISERRFRRLVEKNNKLYGDGQVDYYIAHSSKGYKKTFNWEEVKESLADNRKRAITMLADCGRAEKQFQRRNNLRMENI